MARIRSFGCGMYWCLLACGLAEEGSEGGGFLGMRGFRERAIPYRCCFRPILRSFCGRCIAGRRGRRLRLMGVCGGGQGLV